MSFAAPKDSETQTVDIRRFRNEMIEFIHGSWPKQLNHEERGDVQLKHESLLVPESIEEKKMYLLACVHEVMSMQRATDPLKERLRVISLAFSTCRAVNDNMAATNCWEKAIDDCVATSRFMSQLSITVASKLQSLIENINVVVHTRKKEKETGAKIADTAMDELVDFQLTMMHARIDMELEAIRSGVDRLRAHTYSYWARCLFHAEHTFETAVNHARC